ncbi:MAG TPA: peptide-methionine (R)-S-oxide reductase MsrB [Pyrinomonadaceae bacterium]|jgi:peptide-methionine (R)-S-oxide reductase|nr:peptide-methionine (R)-S-oxide reductase MsrB [Pyrinomonadaceae bacterium]
MTLDTRTTGKEVSDSGYDIMPISDDVRQNLAADLTEEQREILLNQGTEAPFCGNLTDTEDDGVYACRLCGLPLFRSDNKFHSRSGWASFYAPFDTHHIRYLTDTKYGMSRTEIRCARCDGHLGHVFDDGPAPTGQRYCLNSASLEFFPAGEEIPQKV